MQSTERTGCGLIGLQDLDVILTTLDSCNLNIMPVDGKVRDKHSYKLHSSRLCNVLSAILGDPVSVCKHTQLYACMSV